MCIVKWKDNKSVLVLFTAFGIEPDGSCPGWFQVEKKKGQSERTSCSGEIQWVRGWSELYWLFALPLSHLYANKKSRCSTCLRSSLIWPAATGGLSTKRFVSSLMRKQKRLDVLEYRTVTAVSLIKAETRHHKAESDDEAEDTKCNKEVQNHFSASRWRKVWHDGPLSGAPKAAITQQMPKFRLQC